MMGCPARGVPGGHGAIEPGDKAKETCNDLRVD
jgi:hypothetical protein